MIWNKVLIIVFMLTLVVSLGIPSLLKSYMTVFGEPKMDRDEIDLDSITKSALDSGKQLNNLDLDFFDFNDLNINELNKIKDSKFLEDFLESDEGEKYEKEKSKQIREPEEKDSDSEKGDKSRSDSSIDNNNCRKGNVLKNVEEPKRFKILDKCIFASGKVHHVKWMDDGDYKFTLELDKKYEKLLNKGNNKKTKGYLVIEIIPKDQDSKNIDFPEPKDKVNVWGAWVTDKPKGWNEIHPAWKVEIK